MRQPAKVAANRVGRPEDQSSRVARSTAAAGDRQAAVLYDVFVELIARWSTQAMEQRVIDSSGTGVDATQFQILELLSRARVLLAGELAEPLQMSPSNVSKVLARMESDGLIHRRPSESDRRAVEVTLTRAGVVTARALRSAGEAMLADLFADWTSDDATALASLLQRLLAEVRTRQFSQHAWPDGAAGPNPLRPSS